MKLQLPDVTLVLIETREHDLAQMALEDCERLVKFGGVLVFTDLPSQFMTAGRTIVTVPDWPEKIGWSRCLWNDVAPHLRTSHMLSIQWDSWIKDVEMWRDEFLKYDYIGAPWWYKEGKNVGNGGFSLRSTALMRYVRQHRDRFPCISQQDDNLLSRTYRPALEDAGFVWAPEKVAFDFAFECVRPDKNAKHFGFHGMFNWGAVLEPERLIERARMAQKSKYITGNKHMWDGLMQGNPDLVAELAKAS